MITENKEWDTFVRQHRWGVLTTMRGTDPVSSVVAYACDGDDLVISTPGFTFKRKSIEKSANVNFCVITNQEPFNFVAIEGDASIEQSDIERTTLAVFDNIADTGYQKPDNLPEWLQSQQRVIIRIRVKRAHGVIR